MAPHVVVGRTVRLTFSSVAADLSTSLILSPPVDSTSDSESDSLSGEGEFFDD